MQSRFFTIVSLQFPINQFSWAFEIFSTAGVKTTYCLLISILRGYNYHLNNYAFTISTSETSFAIFTGTVFIEEDAFFLLFCNAGVSNFIVFLHNCITIYPLIQWCNCSEFNSTHFAQSLVVDDDHVQPTYFVVYTNILNGL